MGMNTGDRYPPYSGEPALKTNSAKPPGGAGFSSNRGAPGHPAGRRAGGGRLKTITTGVTAGVIAAVLVLLLLPWAFGVSPLDLISGKLGKTGEAQTEEVDTGSTVEIVSASEGVVSVAEVADRVTPSVVNIDIRAMVDRGGFSSYQEEGVGSGVIYSEDGYIITNNHVVQNARDIKVTLASGEELEGAVVGADPESDIAVIRVEKSGLPAIEIGDSDTLIVGEVAVAVGSPFGFEHSVTAGIVSAQHRNVSAASETGTQDVNVLTDLIQTDAAVNPGNSGGALCNSEGKLIGVNTVIATAAGGSEGVGFAVPVNTVSGVADDIIEGRPVSHPYMGVQGQSVSKSIAEQYDLPLDKGAYVTQVVPDGPADKAGLKRGDIVVVADGEEIGSMDELISDIQKREVGDTMNVTCVSGGGRRQVEITLEEKPR